MATVLLVLEVTALLGQGKEVGQGHSSETHVIKRIDGTGLDIFRVVIVESTLHRVTDITDGENGLQTSRQLLHLQPLDLVVETPQRHFRSPFTLIDEEP